LLLFNSAEELLAEAKQVCFQAPENLKESIEPYFISRYFVAIYEARHGEIPIQVWNEYRNALDHLFRHLVSSESNSGQVSSAQKHFLRAALDILKLHIHKTQISINEIKKAVDPNALRLVDNGDFITQLNKDIPEAMDLFESAKINDSKLGDDINKNSSVLAEYLNAAFAFEHISIEINKKQHAIESAIHQYKNIHGIGHKHSIASGIFIHLMSAAIGAILVLVYKERSMILEFLISLGEMN